MITLHIFLVTLIAKMCCSEFIQVLHPCNPMPAPFLPICPPPQHQQPAVQTHFQPLLENTTTLEKPKDDLKFLLPFLDMEVQYDRNLHIMQEVQKQQVYILHGHELYQLFINHQEKRLSLVAVLEGSVRHVDPLGAQVIFWKGNLLLVIALDEHLEVYQLSEDVLIQRAEAIKDASRVYEPAPVFEAIQQLTLTGRFQNLFLFSPNAERVMIVAAVNFTRLYGKLRIFEWFNTYFDPIEDMTVPSIQVVKVIGSRTKYLVMGRSIKHQARTILTIYEISPTSLNILPKQTLTVESSVVHIFSYLSHNMIVACSSKQQSCSSFRQKPDGQFIAYRRRTANEFTFDFITSSPRFVSAVRQNQVMAFTNHRLDCYASFISDQTDVTGLMAYQNPYKEDYVLLVYKRPFKTLVRIVELQINVENLYGRQHSEPEETLGSNIHEHLFESNIGQLRSMLLRRKIDMDKFRKASQVLMSKLKDLAVKERILLRAGKVGTIKIIGKSLKSPKQIVQKLEVLRQNYLPQRSKRSDTKDLPNASMEVTNRVKVKRIRVENLIYHGEIIKGFSLNQTNLKQKVLTIKPRVTTHNINTSELTLPPNLRQPTSPDLLFDLTPFVRVSHLKVDSINGVAWNVLYDSLFLRNRDKSIKGRLVLQSQVKVKNLTASILNGLIVSKLFNLKHPQVIHSHLVISRFFVNDLNAKTVNGLVFEEDIVFSGNDTFIETPVKMHHLSVSGDLQLPSNTNLQHAIEFKQFYTSKVMVNGSLIVNNLKRLNNATKITLGDEEFHDNVIEEKYLLRERAQNFSFPVIFEEAKVTVRALTSNYLNDHPTEQHMLRHKVLTENPLLALFMNVHVQGDIICRDYKSKIAEIKENIIHKGEKVNITGIKLFEAPLVVNNLVASTLNEMPVNALVFKTSLKNNETINFKDSKIFNTIKIKNAAFIEEELKASYLNNLPLENLLNNDYYMERLHVTHLVETSNLVFHRINNIPFDEFFTKLKVNEERLVLHKDLIVEGSVQFAENLEVHYINDIAWNEYVQSLVRKNEHAIVEGDVVFKNNLFITDKFEVTEINGYDLDVILRNVLMKNKPQLITGLYSFDNIKGGNIDVGNINDRPVEEFIDLSKNWTEIEADLVVENLNIGGNLQGNMNGQENLFNVKQQIKQLPLKNWTGLYVLHNASWPAHMKNNKQHELLKYFYKTAVRKNKDQIITGNVNMCRPSIKNMKTPAECQPQLDIDFIRQDALLKNSTIRQIVRAEKVFLRPLKLESLKVKRNLNTKFINGIDVLRFNQSLYRLTSQAALKGSFKFLKPLTVAQLQVNGLINNLNTSLIYQLEPNAVMPSIHLQELFIENDLFIKNINDMSLEYFLGNRVTLKGPALEHFGVLTFEHLVIEKEALLQSINGIAIDELVFKHSSYLQTITGHKNLQHTLELIGPAHVMHINDKDLTELYRKSLRKDHNYEFDNLVLEQATFEGGLQMTTNSNNNMQVRSFLDNDYSLANNNKEEFLKFLIEFKDNLTNSPRDIIYLDYDLNTHIKWLNPADPQPNQTIFHEIQRISCCEKQYVQISFHHPNNFYLKNTTSNRLTKISNKISARAENYCRFKKGKLKSKITISGPNLLKVFAMKRYMETIYMLDLNNSTEHFVILHVLDLPSLKRNEVRIFKISTTSNTIVEWQGLTQNIGEHLKFYKLANSIILLTNGLIDGHPGVTIYNFNNNSQLFKIQQVIAGDYDIMEMFELPPKNTTKQLILSCSKCQSIFIYELNNSKHSGKYEIFQIITLKSPIDKLLIFNIKNDYYMLVISQRDSNYYHIYKYAYVQGWLHLTFGYFPNLQMSIPITELWTGDESLKSDGIPLVLLCNHNNCYLVKAIV